MSNWKKWAHGLVAAFIGGAASSVSVVIVDPLAFDPFTQTKKLVALCLVMGAITAAAYLKQSPLPTDGQ